MDTVAIFGVGLIGGSFALALRKAGFAGRIVGVSSPETIERAVDLKVIDAAASPEQAARSADLIYLAQPILRIIECLPDLSAWVQRGALVTDAGSTKAEIVAQAARVFPPGQFLGGHPMAGRERRGVEAAEADLFAGRPYILTPGSAEDLDRANARELLGWIQKIGARPVTLDAAEHDRIVAFTSHLPQLASTALAALLESRGQPKAGVFGPALVDSTRLALSSYDIWGDILATNSGPIQDALRAYIAQLEEFLQNFESQAMAVRFSRAAKLAAYLRDS
ncbi:MAG TPA: prephenate dehydrogenase/arogenate dehydrogenase family protein [Bryobacteraceae bacterium]|nr:prephenate dehydrogenase/arogenate dehydrogenase family protein [Bryobacteraceae bacterium]